MILYLDTSSLLKLYVEEPGSDDVRQLLDESDTVVATSSLTYVELRAALARRRREQAISARDFMSAKRAFDADWPKYVAVPATPELCRDAGDLAEHHRLRAYDAIHLASYAAAAKEVGIRNVEFSGFDRALNRAAHSLRRTLLRKS